MAVARSIVIALVIFLSAAVQGQGLAPPAYYFVEGKSCTVLVDFQAQRREIEPLYPDQRSLRIVRGLLQEFAANGLRKCEGTDAVRMMAIYIPNVDSYGRPNFAERVNLARIDGSLQDINNAAKQSPSDIGQLDPSLSVSIF